MLRLLRRVALGLLVPLLVGNVAHAQHRPHIGGHETTLWSIMTPMANLGMIIVPPGYSDAVMFAGGSPYGATAATGGGPPGEPDLAAARHQGRRVAEVTGWITHAKSHKH